MRRVLKPAGYHGDGRSSRYFEGWYVKMVDPAQQTRLAVIPGVFLAPEEDGPHEAFVQVLDGATGRSWYVPYPMSEFAAHPLSAHTAGAEHRRQAQPRLPAGGRRAHRPVG